MELIKKLTFVKYNQLKYRWFLHETQYVVLIQHIKIERLGRL